MSAAPRGRRSRLVAPWPLLAFGVLMSAALAWLFPRGELMELIRRSSGSLDLRESYLANLRPRQQADAQADLLLARIRLARGHYDEALPLASAHAHSADPQLRLEAQRLRIDILRARHAGDTRRASAGALAAAVEASLGEAWSRDDLLALAEAAESARDARLTGLVYERVLRAGPGAEWLEGAARRFLQNGDYRFASRLFFAARTQATEPQRARALYLAGVRALQAGNMPREALAAAERELGPLAEDRDALLELVHVARAANRPEVAARYMKEILWPKPRPGNSPWRAASWRAADAPIVTACAASEPDLPTQDARLYELAYEVFLASGDVDSAYRLARVATGLAVNNRVWRERLARVAEQSGRLAESLAAWRWLAERAGVAEAWQAILRLARSLNDEEALVAALQRRLEQADSRPAHLAELADAYERLGQPAEGAAWLEAYYRRTGVAAALELAADLAEEKGDRERALELNAELFRLGAPSLERALRVSALLVHAGRFDDALALMREMRPAASTGPASYWGMLAELAWMKEDDGLATEAYRELTARPEATVGDFDRLVSLLRESEPAEAARVAEAGYAHFGSPALLLHAIELLAEKGDVAALGRVYDNLAAEDESRLFAQSAHFYRLRAQFRQRSAHAAAARRDLQRAIVIAPEDAQHRFAMLWLLIDQRDLQALRPALAAEEKRADAGAASWAPLAAGWMMLDEPRRALPYLARLARQAPDDFIGLLAYADALERDGRRDAADRVLRHAWSTARAAQGATAPPRDRERREHFARLVLRYAPGDSAMRVLRALLRDGDEPSPAVREMVTSWLLVTDQPAEARAWLRQGVAPASSELAVAEATGDRDTAVRLLDERAELPAGQAAQAARLAQRMRLAQTLSFEALNGRPEDDALHAQASETLLDGSHRAAGGFAASRRGVVQARARELGADVGLHPQLRLAMDWRSASQQSTDESVLRGVPAADRELRITARQRLGEDRLEAGAGAREAFADTFFARVAYSHAWSQRLTMLVGLSHNERSFDSSALAVAGMRDALTLRAAYAMSKTEYAAGQVWTARYRTQNGVRLGSAEGSEWEAGHRLRLDYPDLVVRVLAAHYKSSPEGEGDPGTAVLNPAGTTPGPEFFLPASSQRYGVGASVGEQVRQTYTRALRPYGALDMIHNSATGNGYNARVGVRGRVTGPDQVSLYWSRGRSAGPSNDSVLEYGMRYEVYF
ncbi:MAG TPA: tetratricopeptide repeat protein [Burkholderiales bacterium]|nr:tetratricopeptide repeat protein [Burkholderiales bacterium]